MSSRRPGLRQHYWGGILRKGIYQPSVSLFRGVDKGVKQRERRKRRRKEVGRGEKSRRRGQLRGFKWSLRYWVKRAKKTTAVGLLETFRRGKRI
jgi:hypothetical protein